MQIHTSLRFSNYGLYRLPRGSDSFLYIWYNKSDLLRILSRAQRNGLVG